MDPGPPNLDELAKWIQWAYGRIVDLEERVGALEGRAPAVPIPVPGVRPALALAVTSPPVGPSDEELVAKLYGGEPTEGLTEQQYREEKLEEVKSARTYLRNASVWRVETNRPLPPNRTRVRWVEAVDVDDARRLPPDRRRRGIHNLTVRQATEADLEEYLRSSK